MRPVVAAGVTSAGTPLVHHFADGQGFATAYAVTDSYFTAQENGREPQGCPILDRYPVSEHRFTADEIRHLATAI